MWETLHQYLNSQCNTIVELLPEIGKKAGKDNVHKLRVTIKRARACIALVQYLTDHAFKGKQYTRLLKTLHLSVGASRDIALQQEHLHRYTKQHHPKRYNIILLLLKNHQQLAIQQAQAIAAAFPVKFIKALPGQMYKKQGHSSFSKQLHSYLQEQYDAIAAPAGRVPPERWHDLRKDVKRLHYQLEMVPADDNRKQALKAMLDFTGNAGSQLGAWHDLLAFRQLMKDSIHLMQSRGVAAPQGSAVLLQQISADIRKQLQACRLVLAKKPAVKID